MHSYKYFIGIDIAKENFEVAFYNPVDKSVQNKSFSNNKRGFAALLKHMKQEKTDYFITMEATGGYEEALLFYLAENSYAVSRISTLKSSYYMRSLRIYAKNDVIDAHALALLGAERYHDLKIFEPPEEDLLLLQKLSMRRNDLMQISIAERQRIKHPNYKDIMEYPQEIYEAVHQQILKIEDKISEIIKANEKLRKKRDIMTKFKGIGAQTSAVLLTILPELGQLTRRQIASLAGVAPHPKESGMHKGYRSTKGGRSEVKKALFMAALSAKNYNPTLKEFYDRLIQKGKKKMVALTAVMRKMIVILNAKIRDECFSN